MTPEYIKQLMPDHFDRTDLDLLNTYMTYYDDDRVSNEPIIMALFKRYVKEIDNEYRNYRKLRAKLRAIKVHRTKEKQQRALTFDES